MAHLLRLLPGLALLFSLGGCGVPAPSRSLIEAPCPPLLGESAALEPDEMFVMSSSLPDCRGESLTFGKFRNHKEREENSGRLASFALSRLTGPEDEPWNLHDTRLLTHDAWRSTLTDAVNGLDNRGRLLVYIHGYNNDFEDALEMAMILRRLDESGIPTVVVSWPSRNRIQSYVYDEASLAWAQDYLDELIAELVGISGDITIVSHSLGGRALISAVEHIQIVDPDRAGHIRRAVLVSPDVDRHEVLRQGGALDRLLLSGREVVIYASYVDLPIRLSRNLHGYSRLGSSDCSYDVDYDKRGLGREGNCHWSLQRDRFQIVETARASNARGLRHADVFDTCAGRYDLRAVLQGKPAEAFEWREVSQEEDKGGASISPEYFEDRPQLCDEVFGAF